MDIAALNSTEFLRKNVLKWVSLCFGCLALVFAGFNLTVNNLSVLGYFEVVFSLYCFCIYFRLGKHPVQVWQSVVMCAFISFIVVFGAYIAAPSNGVFVWAFVLPTLYYLLLGKNYGFIFSIVLLSLQSIVLINKSSLAPFTSLNLCLNILFAYIVIWAISHTFESSRSQFSKRLKKLAMLDPLTGAGNRLAMNHYFSVELRERAQLYLFLVDLDYFKQINDKYGHDVGDKVLIEVATLLKVTFAKGYVFRVGGEEFALISSFNSEHAALAVAEKVRAALENKYINVDNYKINLTASIGVANYKPQQSLNELLKAADKQLYKAKDLGRNSVYYPAVKSDKTALI
ncbi:MULTISPECIES: GGDEF domain-containing protein [Pseudoalteromonas]|uniref:GGDEF domain-containing protein n=1 Tax=Pseudoalteromonas TaxID=53246 RepID=UPI00059D43C7|nr:MULTISPECIES: GGDEF domain-containing protein [Pseudoalteromonas]MBB1405067.1 GGDEF domain-containing protein [Pseudoalteromonas sp. SG44-5]|tara:strand:- start:5996 stop:7027 length:1032 start_codon:yes stop_codon:yes gene_type:complete